MRKFLRNSMILTFQTDILTDILTFQKNFLLSDYSVMGLKLSAQKVWVFLLVPRGPHSNKGYYYHTEMTEQLNPRKNFKTAGFAWMLRGPQETLRGTNVARGPLVRHPWSGW